MSDVLIQRLLTPEAFSDTSEEQRVEERKTLGAVEGVFIPTCENMWGVVMFLRFQTMVQFAGFPLCLLALTGSCLAALCTVACLAAIASSGGPVSEGSPYLMISRALGPHIGAAIGLVYYVGILLLAVMESLGAAEVVVTQLLPELELEIPAGFAISVRATTVTLLCVLLVLVSRGLQTISRISGVFLLAAVAAVSLTAYLRVQTWSAAVFSESLQKHPPSGDGTRPMSRVLGLMFTCYSGIFSGADRAEFLREADAAITRGTYAAVLFSTAVYVGLLSLVAGTSEQLQQQQQQQQQQQPGNGSSCRLVLGLRLGLETGVVVTCLAQVLQCLVVGPQILRLLAREKVLSGWLLGTSDGSAEGSGERRCLWVTGALALGVVGAVGQSLDFAANLVSMCFLVCYTFVNVACLLLTVLETPTWRPRLGSVPRFAFILAATAGVGLCVSIMFVIDLEYALLTILSTALLYGVLNWTGEEAEWGSGLDGLRFSLALSMLAGVKRRKRPKVNWRPHILAIYEHAQQGGHANVKIAKLVSLVSQLRRGRGLSLITNVVPEGTCAEIADAQKENIEKMMAEQGLAGFVTVTENFGPAGRAAKFAVALSGLGEMRPNTVLLEWPASEQEEFVRLCAFILRQGKALMCVKNLESFSSEAVEEVGTIDLWWFIHDGGLILCLCWLLTQHAKWSRCTPRVFIVLQKGLADAELIEQRMTKLLRKTKILVNAAVQAVLIEENASIEPFRHYRDLESNFRGIPHSVQELLDLSFLSRSSGSSSRPTRPAASAVPASPYEEENILFFHRLNRLVYLHSRKAALVIMNLPDIWSIASDQDCRNYLHYCEFLTGGLDRVLFVHSAGDHISDFF